MKKVIGVIIMVLLLLVNTRVVIAEPIQVEDNFANGNITDVANTFLERFSLTYPFWEDSVASNPIALKNKEGQKVVTVCDVKKENNIIGYIIVGINKNISPIVSLGKGELINNLIKPKYEKILKKFPGIKVSNPEIMFGGPGIYGIKVDILQGGKMNSKIIDLQEENFSDHFPNFSQSYNARQKWDSTYSTVISSKFDTIIQPMLASSSKDLTVRSYDQDNSNSPENGCGPAAGAMILNYWDERGYTDLQSDSDRLQGINLMNHLFDDMGTDFLGTSYSEWTTGVEKHANVCNSYNFDSWVRIWDYEGEREIFWSELVYEINNNRPVGLWFPYGGTPYSYHIVAGRGWYEDYSTPQRMYHVNTWGTDAWHDFDSSGEFHLMYVIPSY